MGELSDRFGELMARLAKSDADLFRTIGAQNASIRQLVDDFAPVEAPSPAALAPAALLPPDILHSFSSCFALASCHLFHVLLDLSVDDSTWFRCAGK